MIFFCYRKGVGDMIKLTKINKNKNFQLNKFSRQNYKADHVTYTHPISISSTQSGFVCVFFGYFNFIPHHMLFLFFFYQISDDLIVDFYFENSRGAQGLILKCDCSCE